MAGAEDASSAESDKENTTPEGGKQAPLAGHTPSTVQAAIEEATSDDSDKENIPPDGSKQAPVPAKTRRLLFRGLSPTRPSTWERLGPDYLSDREPQLVRVATPICNALDHCYDTNDLVKVLDGNPRDFCVCQDVTLPSDPSRFPGIIHDGFYVPVLSFRAVKEEDKPDEFKGVASPALWTSYATPPIDPEHFESTGKGSHDDRWTEDRYSRPVDPEALDRLLWHTLVRSAVPAGNVAENSVDGLWSTRVNPSNSTTAPTPSSLEASSRVRLSRSRDEDKAENVTDDGLGPTEQEQGVGSSPQG